MTPRSPQPIAAWQRAPSRRSRKGSSGLAVDLGSANVRVATPRRLVVDAPTVIAHDASGEIIATGMSARDLIGRNPRGIEVSQPVRGAAVVDVAHAERLLGDLLDQHSVSAPARQDPVVVTVPLVVNDLQRRALLQCVERVFAKRQVLTLDAPIAAAIGAGLSVEQPHGMMVVDVGYGSTEAAIISLGAMAVGRAAPIGASTAVSALADHLRATHDLDVGWRSTEQIVEILAQRKDQCLVVRGIHRSTGLPRAIELTLREARAAIDPVLDDIASVVRSTLDVASAPLGVDVLDSGIVLTGGAARLHGLAKRVATVTGVPVAVHHSPERAVIDGARSWLRRPLGYEPCGISC